MFEDAYPLTRLQAGMLFHGYLDSGLSTYQDISSLLVSAPFDRECLEVVIEGAVSAHDVLRSSIDLVGFSVPVQLVHASAQMAITVRDLRGMEKADQQKEISEWREQERGSSFELSTAPLFRVHVQRISDAQFWLNLSFHHAILDGWSLSLLTSGLLRAYDQALDGRTPAMPTPRSRFRDYVELEGQALSSAEASAYWRELVESAPVAELPRWRDAKRTERRSAVRHTAPLATGIADRLHVLATEMRVAPKSIMYAVHAAVLASLAGEDTVMFGRVANCRPETADADQMVGIFLNTLPMVLTTKNVTWSGLVRQAHEAEVEALPFRRYPLGQIIRESGRESLFETIIDYRNLRNYGTMDLKRTSVVRSDFFEQTNFPFSANFGKDPIAGSLQLRINYDEAIFTAEQIEVIAGYYAEAFDAIVCDADSLVSDTLLVGSEELNRLLVEWNDNSVRLEANANVIDMLAEAVGKFPESCAVRSGGKSLTYAQLDARSNWLAWRLRENGAGPEEIIGLYIERSVDLVVALIAVLKSGAAYLPLDPSYPEDRLAFILDDSGTRIVLSDTHLPSGSSEDITVMSVDTDAAPFPFASPPFAVHPEHLAYVIYTSGSTGRPKGVQISHRSLTNLVRAMSEQVGLEPTDRWLALTSLSFDIASLEVFAPLLGGAELIVQEDVDGDAVRLLEAVRSAEATLIQATPSGWQMLLEAGLGEHPSVRIICGGEALPQDLAERLNSRFAAVWNAYGPTETTIWSSLDRIGHDDSVTIGRPLANTDMYVLDHRFKPVPTGTVGDLYIGGAGLARGLHNRPGATAGRFVPSPWGRAGARLFRTGDRARWQPDGRLDFLGRSDYQVKVRGHRIELGEIEAVLVEHPAVTRAVASVTEDGQALVTHVAVVPGDPLTSAELSAHAAAKLPMYMVPSVFILMDSFPQTPNGKIDRKALPAPEREDTAVGEFVEPVTETERVVAQVWASELGIGQVGSTDSFRALGGDSITALRIVLRIRDVTGVEVPIGDMLTGTVASTALAVESGGQDGASVLVPLRTAGRRSPYYIVHPLGGGVFGYQALADALPPDQPFFGLQAMHIAGVPGTPPTSIEEMARHYLVEIRAVQPEGPYHLAGWCMGGAIAYEMARQVQQGGDEVASLLLMSSSIEDPVPEEYADDPVAVLLGTFGDKLPVTARELRALEPGQRLARTMSLARDALARPDIGTEEELDLLVRTYQRHAKALLDYRDQRRLPYRGDVALIRAQEDSYPEGDLGWGVRVAGRVIVTRTPGTHHSMLSGTNAGSLAERLDTILLHGVTAVGQGSPTEGAGK